MSWHFKKYDKKKGGGIRMFIFTAHKTSSYHLKD